MMSFAFAATDDPNAAAASAACLGQAAHHPTQEPCVDTRPGDSYPLGATWDGRGTNFALFSENAERVTLCLFASPQAGRECERIDLTEVDDHVFHAYVPGVGPG